MVEHARHQSLPFRFATHVASTVAADQPVVDGLVAHEEAAFEADEAAIRRQRLACELQGGLRFTVLEVMQQAVHQHQVRPRHLRRHCGDEILGHADHELLVGIVRPALACVFDIGLADVKADVLHARGKLDVVEQGRRAAADVQHLLSRLQQPELPAHPFVGTAGTHRALEQVVGPGQGEDFLEPAIVLHWSCSFRARPSPVTGSGNSARCRPRA